jgi:hypothetical protein
VCQKQVGPPTPAPTPPPDGKCETRRGWKHLRGVCYKNLKELPKNYGESMGACSLLGGVLVR